MGHYEKVVVIVAVCVIGWGRSQALDSSVSGNVEDMTTPNPNSLEFVEAMPKDGGGGGGMVGLSTSPLPVVSSSASSGSPAKIKNSVRVLDFISLTEEQHEVEFILDLVQEFPQHLNKTMVGSGLLDSKLLKFRELTTLQDTTLPGIGGLRKSRKVKATIPCKMIYSLYPYDLAVCTFVLFPGGGPAGAWGSPSPVELCPGGMDAYEFHVKGYLSLVIPGGNTTGVDMLTLSLLIQRTSGTQIFSQIYSPVLALVIISFMSMNKGSHAFRIAVSSGCLFFMIVTSAICWIFIPRNKGDQTATEYYVTFCIGFTWQVVFTNILIYRYLLNGDNDDKGNKLCDIESNGSKPATNGTENGSTSTLSITETEDAVLGNGKKAKSKLKISPGEMHILKMGKFSQYVYFKMLRPAYWQLPLWFIIFNVLYFVIVLYISSGLPAGFLPVPEAKNELEQLCL